MKMKEILLEKEKIHRGSLILVNAHYPITEQKRDRLHSEDGIFSENCLLSAEDLVPVSESFPQVLLKRRAASMLQLALKRILAGERIVPVSGYRSFREQTEIYNSSLEENGEAFTGQYVALPNHSEHQSGLAIDLGLNREEIDFIRPDFPCEGICEAFRRNAAEYGFIQRYEADKESMTGIAYEPWHFRYVGRLHAQIIKERHFALEEYIGFIRKYREKDRFKYKPPQGGEAEIFFIPAEKDRVLLEVPEDRECHISGNNVDGFIVTLWKREMIRSAGGAWEEGA